MALAKYFEDNFEIMCERQATMQARIMENNTTSMYTNFFSLTSVVTPFENNNAANDAQKHYEDRYIFCRQCGSPFLFTANMQKHYDKNGWEAPKRCKCCRERRNAAYLMHSSF